MLLPVPCFSRAKSLRRERTDRKRGDAMSERKHRHIEVIARGVCVVEGRVLLCHSKGAGNTYLPGGHVEFGETSRESLRREIMEEMGKDSKVGRFLGAVENSFTQRGRRHCEVNMVHEVSISGVSPARKPESCEDYIEFLWAKTGELRKHRLLPLSMIPLIADCARTEVRECTFGVRARKRARKGR